MKISSISTLALNNGLRSTTSSLQDTLVRLQEEVVTGRFADTGLELGARSANLKSLRNDLARLDQFTISQSRTGILLEGTQLALGQLGTIGEDFVGNLVPGVGDSLQRRLVRDAAENALDSAILQLNNQVDGAFIFGGENVDQPAMEDYEGSALQASIEAAFLARFGFAISDPATSGLDATQIEDFLSNDFEPLFASTSWGGLSNASDNAVTNRIAEGTIVQTGVTANDDTIRDFFMGTIAAYEFYGSELGGDALGVVGNFSLEKTATAINGISQLRGEVGLTQARIERTRDQTEAQILLVEGFSAELEGVDVYEKSAELNNVITQIEISYSITSRVQQLSIMRFL
ncbi:MAG: flagellar hook-associated family protein [Pseudomonadota bacterium]